MEERKSRVMPEPNPCDPHVTVLVRHLSLGTKVRLFGSDLTFSQVYDWVGGLTTRPRCFELRDYDAVILPNSPVRSGSFNMIEVENPILMSPQGNVAFRGFGW